MFSQCNANGGVRITRQVLRTVRQSWGVNGNTDGHGNNVGLAPILLSPTLLGELLLKCCPLSSANAELKMARETPEVRSDNQEKTDRHRQSQTVTNRHRQSQTSAVEPESLKV